MKPARAWVRLQSGRRLNLLEPDPASWTDSDLAIGLSRTYRWGGHSCWERPSSVAQHSLLVLVLRQKLRPLQLLSQAEALRELLHDADEGLLSYDPISPVKPHLGEDFRGLATSLQAAVRTRYSVAAWDDENYAVHKQADRLTYASKRRSDTASEPRDHYADVTAQIIAALEAGTPPWRRPWDREQAGGPTMPHNATTGARYRGINTLVLGMSPLAFMTCDPRWATYKQAADRGWQVRKGSRGTPGFFYKKIEVGDREGGSEDGRKVIPLLRSFTLFHASQIEGIPPYVALGVEEAPWREPEAAATIARNSRAVIRVGGDRAFYSLSTDHVQLPPKFSFRSPAAYASVVLA